MVLRELMRGLVNNFDMSGAWNAPYLFFSIELFTTSVSLYLLNKLTNDW